MIRYIEAAAMEASVDVQGLKELPGVVHHSSESPHSCLAATNTKLHLLQVCHANLLQLGSNGHCLLKRVCPQHLQVG